MGSMGPAARLCAVAALGLVIAGCGVTRVEPSGSSSPPSRTPASGEPTTAGPASPDTSPNGSASADPGSTAGTSPSPAPPGPPSVEPFTPPPEMEPLDDEVCLALATRADAEDALGLALGDITAQGTDPNIALTCTYPAASGEGQLLITTATDDPSAYETEVALAESYGQDPQPLAGVGDQAFYAAATSAAPEQVMFMKGPVAVRIWNQTGATIGEAAFTTLATGIAAAIHGETPPGP